MKLQRLKLDNLRAIKVMSKPMVVLDLVEPQSVKIGGSIHVGGWGGRPSKKAPAKGVAIVSDGKQLPVFPKIGLKREDVARAYKDDSLKNSG